MIRKLMVLLVAVFAIAACSSGGSKSMPSFDGKWHAQNFDATIKGNHIEIQLKYDDSSSLYWQGTFPQDTDAREITSVADKKALDASILGSQDNSKVFAFDHGELTFEMSMLGTTRTVHLKKV